jgi:hypothetical protein
MADESKSMRGSRRDLGHFSGVEREGLEALDQIHLHRETLRGLFASHVNLGSILHSGLPVWAKMVVGWNIDREEYD